ncbi:helix-turn-helix domain-containing protein [Anaerocolumna aminovalerica]|uniref:helix-turn-helix domain-containing protein n=1 Tax=Anaerocolumna aminovalerica TaxID=1527 RepID=UPI00248C6007|nr:helix-turn-helix transcriptional regulator [Anaerocolumna aminovalerica]
MFNTTVIGKKIAQLRKEKNLTQMELADIMGVSYQAVSNWERGNSMPDISKLTELTVTLGVSIDDLLDYEKPVKLVKHILEGTEDTYIYNDNVTASSVVEIAPILKPEQTQNILESIIKKNQNNISISDIISLAPFLNEELLESYVNRLSGTISMKEMAGLCPFLSSETVDRLALKINTGSLKELTSIAPFMSDEGLNEVVKMVENENMQDIIPLAPYLSEETLDTLAMKAFECNNMDFLPALAPYLSTEILNRLAEEIVNQNGFKALKSIAPYL